MPATLAGKTVSAGTRRLQTLGQVIGIALTLAYVAVLVHKGTHDFRALADAHPDDFWPALARHLLRILGGG